jgi:hypothetical protein
MLPPVQAFVLTAAQSVSEQRQLESSVLNQLNILSGKLSG